MEESGKENKSSGQQRDSRPWRERNQEKKQRENIGRLITAGTGLIFFVSGYTGATREAINSLTNKVKDLPPRQGTVQKVSGLPSSEAYEALVRPIEEKGSPSQAEVRDYRKEAEELKTVISYLAAQHPDWLKEKGLKPEDIEITITPHFGQVAAKDGLKVRLFPDVDPRFGIATGPEDWLQYGQYVTWPHEVKIGNDSWAASRSVRHKDEKGEVSQWFFYGVNVKGEEWIKEFKAPAPLQ